MLSKDLEGPLLSLSGNGDWTKTVFIGNWRKAPDMLEVLEPATGESLVCVGAAVPASIAVACEAAQAAQPAWASEEPAARAHVLNRVADLLQEHRAEIARWIVRETGSIEPKAQYEIGASIDEARHAAALVYHSKGEVLHSSAPDALSTARRIPIGTVGVITPWNVPLALAFRSLAPAIAVGNAAILKPDPHTPVSGGIIVAKLFEAAGLPSGVLSVLPGGADVGAALVEHPGIQMITFTGSTAVGRKVGEVAGRQLKRVALELGGNSPMIILDDVDLTAAASCGAFGSFNHQGQVCMATGRHIVLKSVAEEYAAILAQKAAHLPVGNPATDQVALGPIINARQLQKIASIVEDSVAAGAKLLAGGKANGPFYPPTVLMDVKPGMPAFDQEIFGPVAPIIVAEDEDHAVELANASAYGLAAAVQTGNMGRGMRLGQRLKSGMVHINDQTIADFPQVPMGGVGVSGNLSRFGAVNNVEEFTTWQWMTMRENPAPYPF
ncbi:aldehyde dehydrogenase [Phaeobacter inhibens]|uniref:benzaldehyde dehydrogenase n=1 Tax=Phaeobacter inhibens TaxID=221822 RepID=UPI00277A1C7B|nr:benzaldehyde dehydrogenase [Phaeobacter inhibens]GLO70899.1 aldehyde dehydrogenase [Phaeobacter inhibens]